MDELKPEPTRHGPTDERGHPKVVVTDLDISIGRLVFFYFKLIIAGIPVGLAIVIVYYIVHG